MMRATEAKANGRTSVGIQPDGRSLPPVLPIHTDASQTMARGQADPASAGCVFDIDTFAVHDGPGIRMAIYFKGCPLCCRWCHSPESQKDAPELAFVDDRCTLCGTCAHVCPEHRHQLTDGRHTHLRSGCSACGICVDHCPNRALVVRGEWVSAQDLIDRAVRMLPFFSHSGGGITLTGGEVTRQADFAVALLTGCRERGIHTAIETCGACSWATLDRLTTVADLILYDLKLMDDVAHREWTGVSNALILENLKRLPTDRVQVRIPLIPDITDTDDNLRGIFHAAAAAGVRQVGLLPFNAAAGAKYEWLGRPFAMEGEPQSNERLRDMVDMGIDMGLDTQVC